VEKYWTPAYQAVSKTQFYELVEKIIKSLKNFQTVEFIDSNLSNNLLLELIRYYEIPLFYDEKSLDNQSFSLMLVFLFGQYSQNISIYNIVYISLLVFENIEENQNFDSISSKFVETMPCIKVKFT
jgi:hypothetical protein